MSYIIEVRLLPYKWQVKHRYRQFVELHEKLIKNYSVNKNLLPPKKILGNRSESFIMERQKALELYLQTLMFQFSSLPEPLAVFLDFQKYEVQTMMSILAEVLFNEGDEIIEKAESYELNPLQLHAITERLKLGYPTFYSNNPKQDIAHLVDFITQLKHLKILGSFKYFGTSNIIPNHLTYDLSMFKFLETIEIANCELEKNLISVDALRTRLKSLKINRSLKDLSIFLLCEIVHWCPVIDPIKNWPFWQSITYVNFSHNSLTRIHPCIKLLSSVEKIDLSHNEIEVIENMETLSELSILILSHNKIQELDHLHTRLGNIHSLNISSNQIKCLHGLSKLFSVRKLFLENNLISSMAEINNLGKLPCLEILNLQNNPITFTVDYRPQLLLKLGSLAPEITLDGLKATEKEIDTVSVLQALKDARNEPMTTFKNAHFEKTNSKTNFPVKTVRFAQRKIQEENIVDCSVKKTTSNSHNVSKFRQQVETLRRIGGNDWLRLLNEMHCPSDKIAAELAPQNPSKNNPTFDDIQFHSTDISFQKISDKFTSESIKTLPSSYQISYPEFLMFLDTGNQEFKEHLLTVSLQKDITNDIEQISTKMIAEAEVFWVVTFQHNECSVREIPVCVLLFQTKIIFLQLKKFTTALHMEISYFSKFYPELVYLRCIKPQEILALNVGSCNAFIQLRIKIHNTYENIVILTMNKDTTIGFVSECLHLYNIDSTCTKNPFTNNLLDIEKIDASLLLSKISVEKQIIFLSVLVYQSSS
ncbi:nischarin [Caerostris extrusa]|uniref:Nischarin n=1 Tax=Caerostris extrusa TaxID=172846 RepID=A0AAV4NJR8_CAEEX|nr:nischarin [Caerostris extrusa]